MQIYFYAPKIYPGTQELIEVLGAKRLFKHDGMRFLNKGVPVEFNNSDVIVCWGSHVPPMNTALVLNANYVYPDQFQVNLRMGNINTGAGYAITPLVYMANYREALAQLEASNWKIKKAPEGGHLPSKLFPGYGTHYYAFGPTHKVTVFNGQILGDIVFRNEIVYAAQNIIDTLGFTFGTVYINGLGSVFVVRKIRTAPILEGKAIMEFATNIQNWIANKRQSEKSLLDMENLLG